jgi:hypothetical protein
VKAYQLMGCTEEDVKTAMMFCFVRACYAWWVGNEFETNLQLSGAVHYLDLLTKEA